MLLDGEVRREDAEKAQDLVKLRSFGQRHLR